VPRSTPPGCSANSGSEALSVRHISEVQPQPPQQQWLVEQLWLASGVGILGGAPKVCKTYLAAEISVAVATGTQALGRFAAPLTGPVLFYGAEDSLAALRTRFEGLAAVRGVELSQMPLYLIDTPMLRLDQQQDLGRLRSSIERFLPRLLVLDPFVRLTAIDENSAAEVSSVLASLRTLQRQYDLAVLVVHHARKSPASHPNQALRGSSDFAAWSDTNLYLSRKAKRLSLYVEHRSAPSPDPLLLRLQDKPAPHLAVIDDNPSACGNQTAVETGLLHTEILQSLCSTNRPMPTVELAGLLHKRKSDVVETLHEMLALGQVLRNPRGWTAVADG
jgi:hypothetical protein